MGLTPQKNDSPTEGFTSPPQPPAAATELVDTDWTPYGAMLIDRKGEQPADADAAKSAHCGHPAPHGKPDPQPPEKDGESQSSSEASSAEAGSTPRKPKTRPTSGAKPAPEAATSAETAPPLDEFAEVLTAKADIRDLDPTGIFRPTNQRWELALRVANRQLVPADWIDSSIMAASALIRQLRRCRQPVDLLDLKRRKPHELSAAELYLRQPPHMRWEAEAAILAREPFDRIAKRFGLSPAVVQLFERLFYRVRDRLDFPSYVVHQYICLETCSKDNEIGALWRHYAYFGGVHVLDALVYGPAPERRPQHPSEVTEFIQQDATATMHLKAMQAARLLKVTPENQLPLLRIFARLRALELTTAKKTDFQIPSNYSENVKVMMQMLPWCQRVEENACESLVGQLPPVKS